MQILVDIKEGHKTGFYLDQRDSRLAARRLQPMQSTELLLLYRCLRCFSPDGRL